MRFTTIDPEILYESDRAEQKKLKDELDKFMEMGVKAAKVDFDSSEYSSSLSLRSSLVWAVKTYEFPIYVKFKSNCVYLIRKDI